MDPGGPATGPLLGVNPFAVTGGQGAPFGGTQVSPQSFGQQTPGTKIGGVEPASNPQGGQLGITPGGVIDTAVGLAASAFPGAGQLAQTGIKEANRAIQFAGQAAGIGVSGLLETFLPTGGSELANKNWLTKIAGGLAGARPALPNVAGGKQGQSNLQPQQGQDGQPQQGQPGQTNHININTNTDDPNSMANTVTHHLGVMNDNIPAWGR